MEIWQLIRRYIQYGGLFGDKVAHGDMAAHKEVHMVVYLEIRWHKEM